MAKGTSSGHRVKGEEDNAAKRRHNTIKGSEVSNAVKVDKSGLRKSASEDSSKKKMITRSISSRKCEEGNERQSPPTPIVKRKSTMSERQHTPSPLRRSERGKKLSSPTSSGLKKSDRGSCSSDIKHRHERKEKRAKVVKLESAKISKSAENNLETEQVKDRHEEQNDQVKLSNTGIGSSEGEINRIDKSKELKTVDNDGKASKAALRRSIVKSKFMLKVMDDNNVVECASQKHILGEEASEHGDGIGDSLCKSDSPGYASSQAMGKQTSNENERAYLDFSEKDIQIAVNDSANDQIDLEKNCEILSLKRKRNYVVGRTIDCISTAELPSPFCLQSHPVETRDTCFKRQRIKNDTMNQEICLDFIDEYKVVHEKPEASGTMNIYEICDNSKKKNEHSAYLGTNLDQNECFTRMNNDVVNNEICLCSTLTLPAMAFIDVYGVVHEKPEASGRMKSFENCDNSTKQNEPSPDLETNLDQNACCPSKLGGKLPNITGIIEDVTNEEKELCGTQTLLCDRLKLGILKLCQILQLPENVKYVVKKLCVYVVDNHRVDHETTTIQQAFQLSLCWTAAYWLNYKISHKESMALAKEKLNFDCKRRETYFVYLKLRCLRDIFSCNLDEQKIGKAPVASEIPKLKVVRLEVENLLQSQSSKQIGLQPEMNSALVRRDVLRSVKLIKKKCRKQLAKLIVKQREKKNEIKRNSEEVILQMEKNYRVELAVIRHLHGKSSIEIVKYKILEKKFSKKIEDEKSQMEICLEDLERKQLAARNKVKKKEAHLVEELKLWAQVELLNKQSPNKTMDKSSQYVFNSRASEEFPYNIVENLQDRRHFTDPNNVVDVDVVREEALTAEVEQNPSDVLENVGTSNSCSKAKDSDVPTTCSMSDGCPLEIPEPAIINGSVEHLIALQPSMLATFTFNGNSGVFDENTSCKQVGIDSLSKTPDGVPIPTSLVSDGVSTSIPDEELLQELSKSINLSAGLDPDMPVNQEKNPSKGALIIQNEDVPLGVSLSTPENLPTFEDQSPIDATVIIPDEEILLQTLQSASHYVAENDNSDSINGMNLSVSDYGLEINQQDSLSNVNSQIILSNEMSPVNLLAVLPSETTSTQGTPIPSNQGQVILPVSYLESLVPGTLLHSAETSSSCFNSSQQAAVNFVAQPPCNLDPYQNALERVCKEAEDLNKAGHEKKLQLKSDWEKEIAQIRSQYNTKLQDTESKYNTKLQDIESELILRNKQLNVNYHKVLKNKLLGFGFWSDRIDLKLDRTPGFQQDVISNMQSRHQPQQTAQRAPPVQIPTISPSSSNLSASSFQPIYLVPNPHPSSATNRSTLPSRPPHVSSVSSSAANLQVDGAIRSPAPHLQPFRPPHATISSSSFPRHTPTLQTAISRPPSSSPSYPQLQPQLPLPSNLPVTCSGATMNMPTPNSSLSALGLFMDVNGGVDVILPNSADICSNLNAFSTLPAAATNITQVNLRDRDGLDMVCLSDDE